MWKGRFKEETDDRLKAYSQSISFDSRLYREDVRGSIAYSKALLKAGILTSQEQEAIQKGLLEIRSRIDRGDFEFRTDLEDIHMNIEAVLTHDIGPVGGKLHTARSRNDQISVDLRLYARRQTIELQKAIRILQRALVRLGLRNKEVILPGYTHLQRAQPVYLAHHLLAYVEMFQRDLERLEDSRKRTNVLPLGSGALAGSTIALDREFLAEELNFPRISRNSMDAVSDRDFVCELLFCMSMIGAHISRLSEDMILWASSEFKFITIGDAYSTGSSLMPQKKNPDVAELARGKTGRLYGNLVSVLTMIKGLPMTYNRDLQEDKEPFFDSIDTTLATLEIVAAMLDGIEINKSRVERAVNDASLLATDLADYLVVKGVPFREAHECIGRLVALTLERNVGFTQLSLDDFQSISKSFSDDVYSVLDLQRSLERRTAIGAPSPTNVSRALEEWTAILEEEVKLRKNGPIEPRPSSAPPSFQSGRSPKPTASSHSASRPKSSTAAAKTPTSKPGPRRVHIHPNTKKPK